MASINWSDTALANLDELDQIIRERVLTKVTWLGKNFAGVVPENLHRDLKGLYKLRVGDYRVVYSIRNNFITIEKIGHRRDIYK